MWLLVSVLVPQTAIIADASAKNKNSGSSHCENATSCKTDDRRDLAIRMLQAYAALHSHLEQGSLLLDAHAVLGESFAFDELEKILRTTTNDNSKTGSSRTPQIRRKRKSKEGLQLHTVAPRDNKYADRHIQAMQDTAIDPDCMEREFDLSSNKYRIKDAIRVLEKCHLVVLRNAIDKPTVQAYREILSDYLGGLHTGRITRRGRTTHGGGGFLIERFPKRWEVLLPQSLASKTIMAQKSIMEILHDPRILSENMMIHSAGAVIAERGAIAGHWHYDDEYIFGDDDSLNNGGIAGHDLPMFAVTMMTPMLNLTYDHGPIEFCMGTSHLKGVSSKPTVFDQALIRKGSPFETMIRTRLKFRACPANAWRVPVLGVGDMVLFDYQIDHRGGANNSPDLRAMVYTTYSRAWYRDANFDASVFQEETEDTPSVDAFQELTSTTRFAIPNKMRECVNKDDCIVFPMEKIENFMSDQEEEENDMSIRFAKFAVSNRDLDVGTAALYLNDERIMELTQGNSLFLSDVLVGAKLDVRDDANGFVYKEWKVQDDQGQIVINKLMFSG